MSRNEFGTLKTDPAEKREKTSVRPKVSGTREKMLPKVPNNGRKSFQKCLEMGGKKSVKKWENAH